MMAGLKGNVWKALELGRDLRDLPEREACLKLIKTTLFSGFIIREAVPMPGVVRRRGAHHHLKSSQRLPAHARLTASREAARKPLLPRLRTERREWAWSGGGARRHAPRRPHPAPRGTPPQRTACYPEAGGQWAMLSAGWVCLSPAVSCGRKRLAGTQLSSSFGGPGWGALSTALRSSDSSPFTES